MTPSPYTVLLVLLVVRTVKARPCVVRGAGQAARMGNATSDALEVVVKFSRKVPANIGAAVVGIVILDESQIAVAGPALHVVTKADAEHGGALVLI